MIVQTKLCAFCGTEFTRHPKFGRQQWEEARYCSRRCGAQHRYEGRLRLCACGCGQKVTAPTRKFRSGHSNPSAPWYFHAAGGRWLVATRGEYVQWARVVMQNMLGGKPLPPGSVVHHINDDSTDDRPENLQLLESQSDHMRLHLRQRRAAA